MKTMLQAKMNMSVPCAKGNLSLWQVRIHLDGNVEGIF
jgi:hypothetical protein